MRRGRPLQPLLHQLTGRISSDGLQTRIGAQESVLWLLTAWLPSDTKNVVGSAQLRQVALDFRLLAGIRRVEV